MSGRRSRDKGTRTERAIAKVLRANGFAATKISRAYQPGHDIVLSLSGRDLCVEVKARAGGFQELYSWLSGRDLLIVKADRQEPLVVAKAGSGTNVGVR
jgi:hypothetical protein